MRSRGSAPLNASSQTPANLAAHHFTKGLAARRTILLIDIEAVEYVEVLQDGVPIAGHCQDAQQFGRGAAPDR